ncbi:acyltransferase [Sphingomonas carotinifaciens]|uniref:acyltransferase n=1 Tax=Sphingomonas carotinifaciens TaxID=1166323 RepID=UPI00196728F8|nr:acyltransferase [Sphingomonas carotinifaciens]
MKVRARILNLMGNRLSRETYLAERVFITGCGLTTEGNVSINAGSHIDAAASIFLGDGVRIACGVMITTTTHLAGPPDLRAGETIRRSVSIGSGTWVGARAIILPGVNIASGCIIGAGAVVAADTLPDGLYVGVPARRIKDLALS